MSPQEASELQWGDSVLLDGQVFRVTEVLRGGYRVHLVGHTYDQIIPPKRLELIWRASDGAAPPAVRVGWPTHEQLTAILAIISARKAAETRKETR
jgi:hypothetical protein